MKTNSLIAWLTGVLTLSLAVLSFVLSFNALRELAARHAVSVPALFPFLVEFGVVIFSLNALYRSLNGERVVWQWVLIISSSLIAGTFNVLHAEPDLVSRTMAAMPSLFLLLSFETFLGQLKHAVKRSTLMKSLAHVETNLEQQRLKAERQFDQMRGTLRQRFAQERSLLKAELEKIEANLKTGQEEVESVTAEVERLLLKKVELETQVAAVKKTANPVQHDVLKTVNAEKLKSKQQAMQTLLTFYRSHPTATLSEAGGAINRSIATVSNYLNELERDGVIHRNGQGVEVR